MGAKVKKHDTTDRIGFNTITFIESTTLARMLLMVKTTLSC